jgi:hypothetical protein
MKLNTSIDQFEKAATPEELKKIVFEMGDHGFCVPEFDSLVDSLASADDFSDRIDEMFAEGVTNADVFFEIEQAAGCMIGAGYDLLRILELWRGRHILGDSAELVERLGAPKIGVMIVENDGVTVIRDKAAASDSSILANPKAVAQRMLKSL